MKLRSRELKFGLEALPKRALLKADGLTDDDIKRRRIDLLVSKAEVKSRFQRLKLPKPRVQKGYLALYSRIVGSAAQGAICQ